MISMVTLIPGWILTIEAIHHLHPLAFALLDVLFLEGVLSLNEFGSPTFDTVLLT